LKLWDTQNWQELLTLEGEGATFLQTAFSADGNSLGSVNRTGTLHIWRAPSMADIEAVEKGQVQDPSMP
jgi:hypothetical protein